jgi:hypothetical protein
VSEERRGKMVCMWLTLVPLEAQELEDDDLSLEMLRLKKIAHILREILFALREQVGRSEEDEVRVGFWSVRM